MCLVPVANTTFEERGSSQVDLVGVSEKRQVQVIVELTHIIHSLIRFLRQRLSLHHQQQGTCSRSNWFGGVQPMKASPHGQHHDGKRLMTLVSNMPMATNVTGARGKRPRRYCVIAQKNSISQTVGQWVKEILDPYLEKQKRKLKLSESQKSLLLLDAWRVHTAKSHEDDFIPWMKRTHPNIILLFIPGGCRSLALMVWSACSQT